MGSVAEAEKAVKKLQNFLLDDHSLKLSLAQRGETLEDQQNEAKKNKLLKKRKQQTELAVVDNETAQSNKLLVKNLAFEATSADVKELFQQYGAVKKVRLPKKVNSQNHRGFGFVEFTTPAEAKQAFKSLQHSHLYGRKIVIEWSQGEGKQ